MSDGQIQPNGSQPKSDLSKQQLAGSHGTRLSPEDYCCTVLQRKTSRPGDRVGGSLVERRKRKMTRIGKGVGSI